MTNVLSCRLQHLPELSDLWQRSIAESFPPYVSLWYALPDLPHPALIRTLQGHTYVVTSCAVSPDGAWIVSASEDNTLKIWDMHTGAVRHTLEGHTAGVFGCAVSPDGAWIVSASVDYTLKIWGAGTGICRMTFPVEGALIACTFHPDGKHLIAAGSGGVYFWELVL